MLGFEHYQDPTRGQFALDQIGDLLRQPLLDLRLATQGVDGAGELAKSDHAARRDVGDMRPPRERQQMMLAETGEHDVLLQDHLFMVHLERLAQERPRVGVQAAEDIGIEPGDAGRRVAQALAIGIFANGEQQLADRGARTRLVHGGVGRDHQSCWAGPRIVFPFGRFQVGKSSAMARARRRG